MWMNANRGWWEWQIAVQIFMWLISAGEKPYSFSDMREWSAEKSAMILYRCVFRYF